jgi:hypothetical protein
MERERNKVVIVGGRVAALEAALARELRRRAESSSRPARRHSRLRFLRAQAGARTSLIDTEPLWWPPAKIVGRYLAPFLAAHLGLSPILPDAARDSALPVEVEPSPASHGAWSQL